MRREGAVISTNGGMQRILHRFWPVCFSKRYEESKEILGSIVG